MPGMSEQDAGVGGAHESESTDGPRSSFDLGPLSGVFRADRRRRAYVDVEERERDANA